MTDTASTPLYKSWIPTLLVLVTLAALPLFLIYDRPRGLALDDVRKIRQLRVLTIDSPTTYYEGPESPLGLEYELAKGVADKLRVDLVMETADSIASIFPRLIRGDAHFAAAGLIVTGQREQLVKFTQSYQEIKQQVVYLRGGKQPKAIEDLIGRDIMVVAGSSVAQRLSELKVKYPDLSWRETSEKDSEQLLYEVWQGLLELTIADSNLVAVARQYYPQLNTGFSVKESEKLAWAFAPNNDHSIFDIVEEYLQDLEQSGDLKSLLERYYGTADSFNYINVSKFRRQVSSVLPRFKAFFEEAESTTGIDWRLLAAQAYQESQWDPNAVSPTGVKGIMQLTKATAEQMKVKDRQDPKASIIGGANYMVRMITKIPARIQEPDRTWFALGAYNIGFGHFEDARILTQKAGKSPDKWVDVKEFLPLLSDPEWYEQTKRGQARGGEALAYVTRVRTFYDILVKLETDAKPE